MKDKLIRYYFKRFRNLNITLLILTIIFTGFTVLNYLNPNESGFVIVWSFTTLFQNLQLRNNISKEDIVFINTIPIKKEEILKANKEYIFKTQSIKVLIWILAYVGFGGFKLVLDIMSKGYYMYGILNLVSILLLILSYSYMTTHSMYVMKIPVLSINSKNFHSKKNNIVIGILTAITVIGTMVTLAVNIYIKGSLFSVNITSLLALLLTACSLIVIKINVEVEKKSIKLWEIE